MPQQQFSSSRQTVYFGFCFILTLLGIYFTIYVYKTKEPFHQQPSTSPCPDILIQQGNKIYLYNSKKATVPGVNPILFENLESYVEFLNWQKSQNISCPVLYLQHSFDTQGNEAYKIRPSITDPQGGLNSTSTTSY